MSRTQCVLPVHSVVRVTHRPPESTLWANPGLALGAGVSWPGGALSRGSHFAWVENGGQAV